MCVVGEENLGKSGMHLIGDGQIKYPLIAKDKG
jgi:hypothetical protein